MKSLFFWFFGIVFLWIASINAYIVWKSYFRKHGSSMVPLLGGIAGVIACIIAPIEALRSLWFVPLLLDLGSVPLIVRTVYFQIRTRNN